MFPLPGNADGPREIRPLWQSGKGRRDGVQAARAGRETKGRQDLRCRPSVSQKIPALQGCGVSTRADSGRGRSVVHAHDRT